MSRLQEPTEMVALRRYHSLGALAIRSTYGEVGLIDREVKLPAEPYNSLVGSGDPIVGAEFLALECAENALVALAAKEETKRLLARRERLPEARRKLSLGQLDDEERRILRLTKTEYARFRGPTGPKPSAKPTGTSPEKPAATGGSDDPARGDQGLPTQSRQEAGSPKSAEA